MKPLQRICLTVALFTLGSAAVYADSGLRDLQGNTVKLEDYTGKGKWLLVMFWASNCPICVQEAPAIDLFHGEHKDKDATVLGISLDGIDNKQAALSFIQDQDLEFPNLIGEVPTVLYNYQIATGESFLGTPSFMLFTPEGKLVANNAGPVKLTAIEDFMARYHEQYAKKTNATVPAQKPSTTTAP